MLRGCLLVYVTEHLEPLLAAQIDNAVGIKHLMVLDPETGKFERGTADAKQIDQALKKKTACWIYTKDPNVQAFTDLLSRALDKPAEHVHIAGHDGSPVVIQWERDGSGTLEASPNVADIPASDVKQIESHYDET